MTGGDTNIVVRLLTGDDPDQFETAKAIFRKEDVFLPETVFLDAEWVLRNAYDFEPAARGKAFFDLCGLPNVTLVSPHRMMTALRWYAEGMDFAEALHLAASQDCRVFLTFDRKMARKAKGLSPCRVKEAYRRLYKIIEGQFRNILIVIPCRKNLTPGSAAKWKPVAQPLWEPWQ